ncbi:Shugoshin C-terminal [Arabidopsis thaliana x Arabidopsis arenosa]|uniref:Shugoshin C-terminal n=1 Tax=Arabidopsis thaliana x Arabidopsis arenosa TaxID=1240361 RepID=A0A8T2ASV6_9BRAS|nr:Shugoshin C-terminal [Arabidopsis thaliana x Arabidopsis arenosa]
MVLEPLMNSAQRRKLGDITNLQNQKNLMNHGGKQQQQAILVSSKGNAENLQKENMRLMKVVTERDGIKSELKKLKIDFQKVQEQNLLLAQANTRILAEFNTSKDQLKVLQHELGCKNGLVMARKLQLKEQTLPCTRHATKVKDHANACGGACKTVQPNDADHENASESSNVNSLQIIEKANNKRRVSGRKNRANSEVLDIIDRLGETCPTEDNIDNKKLVSDGDNAADKKEVFLDAEDHINDNGQRKRYCAGRPSASFKTRDTGQTVNLQKVVDTREKDNARVSLKKHPDWVKSQEPEPSENPYESRFPLRRRSARLKSQEPEPSESLHESIETTRRRRSGMFNIQELGVIQNLNGLHDDQEIAAKAGCSAREQSTGSKPEAVEPHDTKQITRKSRISLRRQSAIFNFQELGVTENLNGPHDQTIAANARCCASEQSIGSKPEAAEPHDMTETIGKSRVSSRRQSANIETPRAIKESADPPLHDDIIEESSQVSSSVSIELKRESKNKPTCDESEEMRKTTVGRPSRQAAEKIKSYKEPSLKEKMRGGF